MVVIFLVRFMKLRIAQAPENGGRNRVVIIPIRLRDAAIMQKNILGVGNFPPYFSTKGGSYSAVHIFF